jgi:hypothetical protein
MRYYSAEDCRRKADQHWDMAGLARQDGDKTDEQKHTDKAREWDQRARSGGWEGTP